MINQWKLVLGDESSFLIFVFKITKANSGHGTCFSQPWQGSCSGSWEETHLVAASAQLCFPEWAISRNELLPIDTALEDWTRWLENKLSFYSQLNQVLLFREAVPPKTATCSHLLPCPPLQQPNYSCGCAYTGSGSQELSWTKTQKVDNSILVLIQTNSPVWITILLPTCL